MLSKDLSFSILFDFYGKMLTEKQQTVIDCYYNKDLSLSEIAENEGITRQGVRDSIKRAEAQLLEMENRLNFIKKVKRIQNKSNDILQEIDSQDKHSLDINLVEKIRDLCEESYNFIS